MAFTQLNSFLLTTDGRLFSWGAITYCLGRKVTHNKVSGGGFTANKATASIEHNKSQLADIGEIEFGAPIVKIATGRSHVLALDSRGKVWSWGANDKG